MPKITFPMFYDEDRPPELAPIAGNGPCNLGRLVVFDSVIRFYPITDDSYVSITMPYHTGEWTFTYTVPSDLYNCIGFPRREEDYYIIIWDRKRKCRIKIPALTSG